MIITKQSDLEVSKWSNFGFHPLEHTAIEWFVLERAFEIIQSYLPYQKRVNLPLNQVELQHVTTQLDVIHKLVEGTLSPCASVTNKDVKWCLSRNWPLRNSDESLEATGNTEAAVWQWLGIAMKQSNEANQMHWDATRDVSGPDKLSELLGAQCWALRGVYICPGPTINLTSRLRRTTSQWMSQKQPKLHSWSHLPDVSEFIGAIMPSCKSSICALMVVNNPENAFLGRVLAFGAQSSCWRWTLHSTASLTISGKPRSWYHILFWEVTLLCLVWSLMQTTENSVYIKMPLHSIKILSEHHW